MVLSRQPVPVGQWAAELARALVGHAEQNAATAEALRRLVDRQLDRGPTAVGHLADRADAVGCWL